MQHTLTFVKDKVKYVSMTHIMMKIRKVRSAFAEMHLTICLRVRTQLRILSIPLTLTNVQRCVLHFGGFTLTLFLQKTSNVRRQRGA